MMQASHSISHGKCKIADYNRFSGVSIEGTGYNHKHMFFVAYISGDLFKRCQGCQ